MTFHILMKHTFCPSFLHWNIVTVISVHSNAPVPCDLLLQGSPLGFDITPFAQQLLRLGGRRRRGQFASRPSPLNPGMRGMMPFRGQGGFMAPMNPGRVVRTGRTRKLY